MNARSSEIVTVGAGIAYLCVLSWAMGNLSYDIWGALVLIPVYGALGLAGIRWAFRGSLRPVARVLGWGLLLKVGGAAARYWIGFEAYGGIDAGEYHRYALEVVGKARSGEASFTTVLPSGIGTEFLQQFTAFIYALTGPSQLAGFVTFSFLAYVGIVFIVKAAITAVPTLAARRYAWMCVLFPSIVYWPSSIGKEAAMMLGLGIGTYGIARMLTHGRWLTSLLIITAGIGFAALIRPHIAGIWIAATLPGLAVALFGRSRVGGRRKPNKFGFLIVLGIGTAMFALLASTTVGYLAPSSDDEGAKTNSLTDILEETTRRTAQADSSFTPPSVSNPIAWPYASIRTLTRPLPFEARTATQLISAAEMTALLGICVLSRKRIRNLPRLLVSNPYVAFVLSALFLAGLAYTSLANLGILTRQKSLLMPFLVLLPCLPARTMRRPDDEKSATQRGDGFRGQLIDSNQPRESLDTGWRISPPQHLETVPGRVIARSPAYDDGEDLWN